MGSQTRMRQEQPLLHFGVLSDVQYADEEDSYNFHQTKLRYYRQTLRCVDEAVQQWNTESVAFVLQIGDLIDGKCKPYSDRALETVLQHLKPLQAPLYHALGNHELYNFSRTRLSKWFAEPFYYAFTPCASLRVIVLNAFELSVAWVDQPEIVEQCWPLFEPFNHNDVRKENIDWGHGLVGVNRRYVPYNGGVGPIQLQWLREQLAEAEAAGQRVIVASHCPLQEGCSSPSTLLWNYEEVLALLHASPTVICGLYGHDHAGGFGTDSEGVHHLTLPSPLESQDGGNAFASITVYSDRMDIHGVGDVASRSLPLRPWQQDVKKQ